MILPRRPLEVDGTKVVIQVFGSIALFILVVVAGPMYVEAHFPYHNQLFCLFCHSFSSQTCAGTKYATQSACVKLTRKYRRRARLAPGERLAAERVLKLVSDFKPGDSTSYGNDDDWYVTCSQRIPLRVPHSGRSGGARHKLEAREPTRIHAYYSPICLGPLKGMGVGSEPTNVCTLHVCKHSFHAPCLVTWYLIGRHSCPTCRAEYVSEQIRTKEGYRSPVRTGVGVVRNVFRRPS